MAKRQKKTTHFEYKELLTFVENNKVVLYGKTKPLEAQNIKILWQTFADKMTILAVSPMKSGDQWKKIFIEWKVNVKRKSRLIKEEITREGGGPKISKPLSDLEKRLLNLISKSHLRDSHLPDSLDHAEAIHEAEEGIAEEEPPWIDETLTEAINKFTEVFKIKAEADMLRAKAEMAKAKCLHFQTFGNLDDFLF